MLSARRPRPVVRGLGRAFLYLSISIYLSPHVGAEAAWRACARLRRQAVRGATANPHSHPYPNPNPNSNPNPNPNPNSNPTPNQVLPPGTHKGHGVAALLRHLAVDPAEAMACGDAENGMWQVASSK